MMDICLLNLSDLGLLIVHLLQNEEGEVMHRI